MSAVGRWLGVLASLAVAAGAATGSVFLLSQWAAASGDQSFPGFAVFLLILAVAVAWLVSRFVGLTLFPLTLAGFGAGLIAWPGWGSAAVILADCFIAADCTLDRVHVGQAARALFQWLPWPQGLAMPLIGLAVIGIAAAIDYGRQGSRLGALTVTTRKAAELTALDNGSYRLSVFLTVSNEGRSGVSLVAADLSAARWFCNASQSSLWAGASRSAVSADTPAQISAGAADPVDVSVAYELRRWLAPGGLAARSGVLRSSIRLTTSSRRLYSKTFRLV